jgi:SAM-dependent methyltransferase
MIAERSLTVGDFAGGLGLDDAFVCGALPGGELGYDFRHSRLTHQERDQAVLKAVRSLDLEDLPKAGPTNQQRWERGWQENLDAIRQNGFSSESLQPKYFHYDTFRYQGDYIRVRSSSFEQDFYTVVRRVLFKKYLASISRVIEFGCGTGTSILLMLETNPRLSVIGCDWSRPSQEILSLIARQTRRDVRGVCFDMFNPAANDLVPNLPGTAVVTLHALEQLGDSWGPMLDYMIALQPAVCIHLEPLAELYRPDSLLDFLALRYHHKRNYLTGFLSELRHLAEQKKVELLEMRRLHFGSFFHEGYSLVVWKPLG